ncbi:hypothetical protein T265_14571, partial [Opisthorchis viverrini]
MNVLHKGRLIIQLARYSRHRVKRVHDILQLNVLHEGRLMFQLVGYSRYRSIFSRLLGNLRQPTIGFTFNWDHQLPSQFHHITGPLTVLYLRTNLSAPASNAQLPTPPPRIIGERNYSSYNHCTTGMRKAQSRQTHVLIEPKVDRFRQIHSFVNQLAIHGRLT